ncbi:hypothetical protein [Lonepinella sp. BR2271]|uniref:hypothetical protein n=1 Tax=Lonepinella sp. BR2271 TaxID=3434550 RepID=UPI003F6DDC31
MLKVLADKQNRKHALFIFLGTMLFLCTLGYNFTIWGDSYDSLHYISKISAFFQTNKWEDDEPLINQIVGRPAGQNFYHFAVVLHVIYAVLLFKPLKRSIATCREALVKTEMTRKELNHTGWSFFIIVAFALNILLFINENNATFLTDISTMTGVYYLDNPLHSESWFYLDGRGFLFVALTALYPVIYFFDKRFENFGFESVVVTKETAETVETATVSEQQNAEVTEQNITTTDTENESKY